MLAKRRTSGRSRTWQDGRMVRVNVITPVLFPVSLPLVVTATAARCFPFCSCSFSSSSSSSSSYSSSSSSSSSSSFSFSFPSTSYLPQPRLLDGRSQRKGILIRIKTKKERAGEKRMKRKDRRCYRRGQRRGPFFLRCRWRQTAFHC